jgi:hypothetical protein
MNICIKCEVTIILNSKKKQRENISFSLESKLENKLVVSLCCRLGIARDTKVSIKKI